MDNITHSLFGYTLGKLAGKGPDQQQKGAILTAIIGSNIPDLDFILQFISHRGQLAYLLQHRGYTHTLLLSFPLGILSAWLGSRLCGLDFKKAWWKLSLLGWVSVLLHICADYGNNYGVHPFSPFLNQWFYADSVYILEPFFWLTCLPLVFFSTHSKTLKVISALLESVLLGLIWSRFATPFLIAVILTVWGCAFIYLQKKFKSPLVALCGILIVYSSFFAGSRVAKKTIHTYLTINDPFLAQKDVSLTPAPGDPFCWTFQTVGIDQKTDYVVRLGNLNLAPPWLPGKKCELKSKDQLATPLNLVRLRNVIGLEWSGEFRRPLKELHDLENQSCQFKAFLKFARIPVWYPSEHSWIMGDLRFDRGKGKGFAQIEFNSGDECIKALPPWTPPTNWLLHQ